MRDILKFQRKTGDYKVCSYNKVWRTETGTHYLHYPFMAYKRKDYWVLTHISSGAEICTTDSLFVCKYIATRLLPVPQLLLPNSDLVDFMEHNQKEYCMDIISRYRGKTIEEVKKLDKICPFTI
jgi:hypothetical protein